MSSSLTQYQPAQAMLMVQLRPLAANATPTPALLLLGTSAKSKPEQAGVWKCRWGWSR